MVQSWQSERTRGGEKVPNRTEKQVGLSFVRDSLAFWKEKRKFLANKAQPLYPAKQEDNLEQFFVQLITAHSLTLLPTPSCYSHVCDSFKRRDKREAKNIWEVPRTYIQKMQSHGCGLFLNCLGRFLFCIPSYAIDQREGGRKEEKKA